MSEPISTALFDEQEFIVLVYRMREQWDAGVLPPRRDLSRLLSLCGGAITEVISQRQRANKAERAAALLEQGQTLLFSANHQPASTYAEEAKELARA